MKKIVGILALIIAVMLSLMACNNNNNEVVDNNSVVNDNQNENQNDNNDLNDNQEEENIVTEPFNQTYDVAQELNAVQTVTGLDETSKMSQEKINNSYSFGNYKDLQMEIRSNESEDAFKEVAIVKIGDNEQSMDLFQVMIGRLNTLKEKYKDNEKILSVLNNNDNIVLKQQGGVLIFIVAENAKEIEAEVDKSFM